jgi:hypothetical protein
MTENRTSIIHIALSRRTSCIAVMLLLVTYIAYACVWLKIMFVMNILVFPSQVYATLICKLLVLDIFIVWLVICSLPNLRLRHPSFIFCISLICIWIRVKLQAGFYVFLYLSVPDLLSFRIDHLPSLSIFEPCGNNEGTIYTIVLE